MLVFITRPFKRPRVGVNVLSFEFDGLLFGKLNCLPLSLEFRTGVFDMFFLI